MKILLSLLLISLAAGVQRPPPQKLQRLPMQKKQIVLTAPTTYSKERFARLDPKTGQEIYYDPRLRIELLDARSGKYALKWVGYDGQEKAVYYQRSDAIDAVVSASVSRTPSGQYLYIYNIKSLPLSGQHLSTFALQTFASDVKLIPIGDGYVGEFSHNREMKEGNWVGFGSTNFDSAVIPSRDVKLRMVSSAPPSLVECRITGGKQGIEVVGEEPPEELLNSLPGYEAWPSGYTIGPVDHLKAMSVAERATDIREKLFQFQRLGWITPDALGWYEQNLRGNNLGKVFRRAEQDLKTGKITSEVHDMIQALRH